MSRAAPVAAALFWASGAVPGQASMTVIHLTASDLDGARVEGLRRLPFEEGLLEGEGRVESPPLETAPFDRLVGSWNAKTPRGGSIEMQVQVRSGGAWSKWFKLAAWKDGSGTSLRGCSARTMCVGCLLTGNIVRGHSTGLKSCGADGGRIGSGSTMFHTGISRGCC